MSNHPAFSPARRSTHARRTAFLHDVLEGLGQPKKVLPCKYFYDSRGSELFEQICQLDEYYLTRCELAILSRYASEMVSAMGEGIALIEYGSGSSQKTRLLLDQLPESTMYLPVDINGEQLRGTIRNLSKWYPHISMQAIEADFTKPFSLPAQNGTNAKRVVYFSGSTIGNFEPQNARDLLVNIARLCGPGGGFLLSVDLKKDPQILHAAYNDRKGITAAFNRNLLARINRELDADFVLDQFDHYAFYDPIAGRIEMHLISRLAQTVHIGGKQIPLAEGESICTEHSYKYTLAECEELARMTGFRLRQAWFDDERQFSVQFYEVT